MPRPRLVLHIGAMKTGTTYLQNLLETNREALESRGWQVPAFGFVTVATREILGLTEGRGPGTPAWDKLTQRIASWDGVGSLVSMEFLSYAKPRAARRIIRELEDADVSVILTVRDAAGALPSQWQSYSRNKGAVTWPDFAHDVVHADPENPTPSSRTFNRTQNIPRMLEVWGEVVPRERLIVVTVPPSSAPRDLLWQRYCAAAGVDPAGIDVPADAFGNPGLGYGSIDLLRRINAAGLSEVPSGAYRAVVRNLARNHLVQLRSEESKPRLDRATAEFAARLNRRTRASARRHATVVGTMRELPVRVRKMSFDRGERPQPAPEAEVRRAAVVARQAISARVATQELRVDPADLEPTEDLDLAVQRLARLMRLLAEGEPSVG